MTDIVAFPFIALWRLFEFVVVATGRLLALVIGLVLLVVGGVLTLTVVGGILGVPLMIVGVLLLIRAIF